MLLPYFFEILFRHSFLINNNNNDNNNKNNNKNKTNHNALFVLLFVFELCVIIVRFI